METPRQLVDRISEINWSAPPQQRKSQAFLVQEFLRRTALWSDALPDSGWPFYDYAEDLDPTVRAAPDLLARMQESLSVGLSIFVEVVCEYALHFRTLQQEKTIPFDLPDPFAPIILVFERGSPISMAEGNLIEVDFRYVRKQRKVDWLESAPIVDLETSKLDAMDVEED